MNNNTKKSLVVFGAGGYSSVLIDTLYVLEENIVGIVDPKLSGTKKHMSIPVIDEESFLSGFDPEEIDIVNAIGSMPESSIRSDLSKRFRKLNYKFKTVVHPSAVLSESILVSEGSQILAGSVVQPNVTIGIDTIINTSASIDHDCRIGNYCHIAPGVIMSGNVSVGENCFIGTGSVIINNIKIGNNTLIAAGSTIFKDLPQRSRIIQKK